MKINTEELVMIQKRHNAFLGYLNARKAMIIETELKKSKKNIEVMLRDFNISELNSLISDYDKANAEIGVIDIKAVEEYKEYVDELVQIINKFYKMFKVSNQRRVPMLGRVTQSPLPSPIMGDDSDDMDIGPEDIEYDNGVFVPQSVESPIPPLAPIFTPTPKLKIQEADKIQESPPSDSIPAQTIKEDTSSMYDFKLYTKQQKAELIKKHYFNIPPGDRTSTAVKRSLQRANVHLTETTAKNWMRKLGLQFEGKIQKELRMKEKESLAAKGG